MARVEPRLLKGFRDYLPDVEGARLRMLDAVRGVFERFGFGPLQTPAIEYAEILLGKYGDEGDKLLYRFRDNGDRDVALRYDLTVPLARLVGQYHGQLVMPFRRYQMAPVWRAEKPARGRFREFMQCDADLVGEPGVRADAEIMMVGLSVLKALGVPACVMRVNDRRILDGVLDVVGVAAGMPRVLVLRAVDKLPKIGAEAVIAEIQAQVGLDQATCERLLALLDRSLTRLDQLEPLRTALAASDVGRQGLDGLAELLGLVEAAGFGDRVEIDLTIARGLDYYTSTIYETFLVGHEAYGSVMSGGRYDGLMDAFSGKATPAVGISLGVDRLLAALMDIGVLKTAAAPADIYMCLPEAAHFGVVAKAVTALRDAGLKVEMALAGGKLGKQFQQAVKRGYRFAAIPNPEELAAGIVQLKDLVSGEQRPMMLADAARWSQDLDFHGAREQSGETGVSKP